jgi:hypothetical protein
MARSYKCREGGYVIDFKVGQSFGEPQRYVFDVMPYDKVAKSE